MAAKSVRRAAPRTTSRSSSSPKQGGKAPGKRAASPAKKSAAGKGSPKKPTATTTSAKKAAKAAKRGVAAKTSPTASAKPTPVGASRGAKGLVAKTLPGAPKGKVSAAAVAEGNAPVRAYIEALPKEQRAIAQHFDALAATTLPGIRRCIKWGMPFYGLADGWFVSCGGFADHVKITFLRGQELVPVPPVGTGKYTRGVDVRTKAEMDDRQLVDWLRQISTKPGLGAS